MADDTPRHRYTAALAQQIEARWQDRWEAEGTFEAPNPAGPLADLDRLQDRPKLFVLDMFPYPSGSGLHVGHPLGYIGTDVYARFKRMQGYNVLYSMGFDAFGLPAEQHAVQTGQHPAINTNENIANMRRQLRRLDTPDVRTAQCRDLSGRESGQLLRYNRRQTIRRNGRHLRGSEGGDRGRHDVRDFGR